MFLLPVCSLGATRPQALGRYNPALVGKSGCILRELIRDPEN